MGIVSMETIVTLDMKKQFALIPIVTYFTVKKAPNICDRYQQNGRCNTYFCKSKHEKSDNIKNLIKRN